MTHDYICALDPGIKNVGLVIFDVNQNGRVVHAEDSSLLQPKCGAVYEEYKEQFSEELVELYLRAIHAKYLSSSALFVMEKQLTRLKSIIERGCIVLEGQFKMCLRMLCIQNPALRYVVMSPKTWRKQMAIEPLKEKTPNIPAHKTHDGRFMQSDINLDHDAHKLQSIQKFIDLLNQGHERALQLLDLVAKKSVDIKVLNIKNLKKETGVTCNMIEAFFIGLTAYVNLEKFREESRVVYNYDTIQGLRDVKFPDKKRKVEIVDFNSKVKLYLEDHEITEVKKKRAPKKKDGKPSRLHDS